MLNKRTIGVPAFTHYTRLEIEAYGRTKEKRKPCSKNKIYNLQKELQYKLTGKQNKKDYLLLFVAKKYNEFNKHKKDENGIKCK